MRNVEVGAIDNVSEVVQPRKHNYRGIGIELKNIEGWKMVLPCCCTNGYEGYFPMKEAYDEGGYETGSSDFKAGVAEIIIEEGKKLLNSLKN